MLLLTVSISSVDTFLCDNVSVNFFARISIVEEVNSSYSIATIL